MKKPIIATLLLCLFLSAFGYADDDRNQERAQLIELIKEKGITDPKVLNAMSKVRRHLFVPEAFKKQAYADYPLPIGQDQTISQPYIVGFMTQALKLKGGEKVLEIGTGSGYQAAVLGKIAKQVYSVEILCELAETAKIRLSGLGYKNVTVRCGDGYKGWKEHAPFDAIIVTAAPDHVPQPLVDQLAQGGRLIIPVGKFFQNLILIQKTDKGIVKKEVLPVRFVPMTGPGVKEKK